MPPKPPVRFAAKLPTASKQHVKPSLPTRPVNPIPRAPLRSKPTPASPSSTGPPPPSPPPPQWHESERARTGRRYITWGTNGVVAICAMLFVRDQFVEIQHVRGSSMAPTLSPDAYETGREDYVIVRPYHATSSRKPVARSGEEDPRGINRGDVVTFWKPHKPGEMGIKRVVAVEGDTVYPTRGYALDPTFYKGRLKGMPDGLIDHDEDSVAARDGEEVGKVVVPYGHVWIEGDNWRKSLDSNDFGPISKGLIQGKAVRVWRDWWGLREVGDDRNKKEKGMRSRIVEGRSEVPAVFLE
ncbi:mitochondrial inner membrane protease subunit 2 [Alternaria panax]|uniref:Mitochondrial inner membrane protease subunit n=1 Tax=Alternaria panax TaxID=48097 RepID=A0AAD4IIS0_9PLEO|nr:mitochondrial inner membrane protease subunit 2 [Alternaria panax]